MNDEANTVATSVMKTTPFTLRRTDRGGDLDLDLDLEPILSTRMVAMAMEMAWRAPSLRTAFDRGESFCETSRPCFDVEKPSADGTTRRLGEDKEGAWYVYGSSRASDRREVLVGAGGGNATYKRLNVWLGGQHMAGGLVCPPPAIYYIHVLASISAPRDRAIHSYFSSGRESESSSLRPTQTQTCLAPSILGLLLEQQSTPRLRSTSV